MYDQDNGPSDAAFDDCGDDLSTDLSYCNTLDFAMYYRPADYVLREFAKKLCSNTTVDHNDVVQTAVLVALGAWARWKPVSEDITHCFRAWLFKLVHRRVIDCVRSNARHKQVDRTFEETRCLRAAYNQTDERCLMGQADDAISEDVERAMAALKPKRRRMVEMAYLESKSASEIAAAIGCSVVTVHTNLHRAKTDIKKRLYRYAGSNYKYGVIR